MNQLQVFSFNSNEVRTVLIDNEPWFVLKDVCDVLEIQNTTDVANRLEEDERARFNLGRQGEANVINESGLYTVILRSDKPQAKAFRRWVTSEVLPSIRKTGGYQLSPELQAIIVHDHKIQKLEAKFEELPLLGVDCDELQKRVRKVAVQALGGYKTPAYNHKPTLHRVFADIQNQIKREFGVVTYKGIKRNQLDTALEIVDDYKLPLILKNEIEEVNNQMRMEL